MQSNFVKFGEFLKKLMNFCEILWILDKFGDFWSNMMIFFVKFNANLSKFGEYLSIWLICDDFLSNFQPNVSHFCWIFAEFDEFLAHCGDFWSSLEIVCRIWSKFDKVLAFRAKLWRVLSLICRTLLSNLVNFWKNWKTFATFIEFWAILMIFGRMWWFFC